MLVISRKQMVWLCHTLGMMLDAGLPVTRALDVLASQARAGRMGRALTRVRGRLDKGATLAEAFQAEGRFPSLFLHLVAVGEESGTLDRTLEELTRFYESQQRLWRYFVSKTAMPVMQYVAAVAVVSFAIYLVNMLEERPGGLVPGLLIGYGIPAGLIALYVLFAKPLGGTRVCHEIVLRLPVLGGVMRALALARFSLVMYLMSEAGVPVTQALVRSFDATNNGAFAARGAAAAEAIENGATVTDALAGTGLFPREYMEIIRVAELSGKLSERFSWLASHYADRAEFAMGALVAVIARLIWLAVAVVIVVFIFKFFMRYLSGLSGAMA